MGAILLCRTEAGADERQALALLEKKGFVLSKAFECGPWHICAMPKIIDGEGNWACRGDCLLVCSGTPIYKGLAYHDGLQRLLDDYLNGALSLKELDGQYTILFCRRGHIAILNDPMNVKHLFADADMRIISSSFLAAVCGLSEKVHIDRMAVYEKFLTGFIMQPRTLFREVRQLTANAWSGEHEDRFGISFIANDVDLTQGNDEKDSREACIRRQAQTLLEWFRRLDAFSRGRIDVGLSGGYDSRLALACLNECCPDKLHMHTHATGNVHRTDGAIARKMAEAVGKTCHVVPTKPLAESDRVDEVLRESVLYFDGRTSFAIGGCGEVYTREYRIESTEKVPVTVTGVGGELYRNVFSLGPSGISIDAFLREKVFSPVMRRALKPEIYETAAAEIAGRVAGRLGVDSRKRLPKAVAHRYYCEIMMPDGQGNAIDAYNQVSCNVAPFLTPGVIRSGYASVRFHGDSGDFEGDMIDRINHVLASIDSSYGYPLNHRPAKVRIKEKLRTLMPAALWERLGELRRTAEGRGPGTSDDLEAVCAKSSVLRGALNRMEALFPEIDFSLLKQQNESSKRLIFVSMTFDLLAERICLDE